MANNNDNNDALNPQKDILMYLLLGGTLTVQKAFRKFGTTELRKIVSRLKRKGYNISSARRYDLTDTGRRVQYNEYFIQAPGALQ